MGLLFTIALAVLSISFIVFIIFFGRLPALRHTPIGALNRLLWVHVPNAIRRLDDLLTGGKVVLSVKRFTNYIAFGRHPTILIFFILLLSVGEYMYLPTAWVLMSTSQRLIGSVLIFFPYLFLYLSATSDPGVVKPENLQRHLALYPYDFALFHPGQQCSTCKTLKPARSKHCAVCNRCVAKLDHHCIFINNCVGYGNQHWFLLLLFSTAVLTLYGGTVGLDLVAGRITAQLPAWAIWKPRDMPWDLWFTGWGYGLQSAVGMGSVTMLATLTSPMVWGLLVYQLYLVWCGTTTNESMKWSDWKEEMADGCAFIRPLPSDRQRNPHIEASWSRWPLEPIQIMVRTLDGTPPDLNNPANMGLQGLGEWQRVWKLADVENLYDLGFWDNMADVFVKDYGFGVNGQLPQRSGTKCERKRKGSRHHSTRRGEDIG